MNRAASAVCFSAGGWGRRRCWWHSNHPGRVGLPVTTVAWRMPPRGEPGSAVWWPPEPWSRNRGRVLPHDGGQGLWPCERRHTALATDYRREFSINGVCLYVQFIALRPRRPRDGDPRPLPSPPPRARPCDSSPPRHVARLGLDGLPCARHPIAGAEAAARSPSHLPPLPPFRCPSPPSLPGPPPASQAAGQAIVLSPPCPRPCPLTAAGWPEQAARCNAAPDGPSPWHTGSDPPSPTARRGTPRWPPRTASHSCLGRRGHSKRSASARRPHRRCGCQQGSAATRTGGR